MRSDFQTDTRQSIVQLVFFRTQFNVDCAKMTRRWTFWFVVIPDDVWRLGRPLSRLSRAEAIYSGPALGSRLARRLMKEPSLFAEDMEAAQIYQYELNFHHQLKSRLIPARAVVQVVRESSLAFGRVERDRPLRRLQDPATLTWNLCMTAFLRLADDRGRSPKLGRACAMSVWCPKRRDGTYKGEFQRVHFRGPSAGHFAIRRCRW